MSTEDNVILRIAAPVANVGNGQICCEDSVNTTLGQRAWGGKDHLGNTSLWAALGLPALFSDLTLDGPSTTGELGILKHNVTGVITGGLMTVAEFNTYLSDGPIAGSLWDRNATDTYVFPITSTDTLVSGDGSLAHPSYAFASDLDTGFFYSSGIKLSIGGIEHGKHTGPIVNQYAYDSSAGGSTLMQYHANSRQNGGGGAANLELKALTTGADPTVDIEASSTSTGNAEVHTRAGNSSGISNLYVRDDDIFIDAYEQVQFDDGYRANSTWTTANVPLAETAAEWSRMRAILGDTEGSIFAMIDSVSPPYSASLVEFDAVNGSSYKDLQRYFSFIQGPCKLVSLEGILSDGGSGQLNVAAGNGIAKSSDAENANTVFFEWSADTGLTLTDNAVNYVFAVYNAVTPSILISTSAALTNRRDYILLGLVKREGTDLDIRQLDACSDWVWRLNRKSSIQNNFGPEYGAGLIIGDAGTRQISITSGTIFFGLDDAATLAFDSSGTDTFDTFYTTDSGTTWVQTGSQTTLSNTQYNDITTGLASIGVGKWGVHWVYYDYSGDHCYVLYGVASYNSLSDAQESTEPPNRPWQINQWGFLIGRVIVQQGTTESVEVTSIFIDEIGGGTSVSTHNNLSGLQGGTASEYYHLTSANYTDLTANLPITDGNLVFGNASGELDHSANLYWDNTNQELTVTNNTNKTNWYDTDGAAIRLEGTATQGQVIVSPQDLTLGVTGSQDLYLRTISGGININSGSTLDISSDTIDFDSSTQELAITKNNSETNWYDTDAAAILLNGTATQGMVISTNNDDFTIGVYYTTATVITANLDIIAHSTGAGNNSAINIKALAYGTGNEKDDDGDIYLQAYSQNFNASIILEAQIEATNDEVFTQLKANDGTNTSDLKLERAAGAGFIALTNVNYIDFNSADLREIDACTFKLKTASFSAGTLTINATSGCFHELEFNADITTFTIGVPTSNDSQRMTLWLKNTDTSAHTIGGISGYNLISPLTNGYTVSAGDTVHLTFIYRDATWGWDIALNEYS